MKELIFLDEKALAPAGGPLGVGYYIYNEAKKSGDQEIEFLKSSEKKKTKEAKQKKLLYRFPRLTLLVRSLRHIKEYRQMLYSPTHDASIFKGYDIVHFHSTKDMYKQRESLKEFNGKTIITSHSPIPLSQELYAACATGFERRFFKKRMSEFEEMDKWSFLNADYIIFPCPDAEEPYYNNWADYKNIKEKKKDSYRYVLTGISPKKALLTKDEIRDRYGIGKNDFTVVYVGRHNEVKGYGNLKNIGQKMLDGKTNTKFLIAGKEGPLTKLENPNWIEVGFTKDPYSIIAAGDVFLLPNNETYFDLVFIEVMSLGKIIVASRTGGNRYYEKAGAKGVFLYDTLDEAREIIEHIRTMSSNEKSELEKANKEFYENNLTGKVFYENYKKVISEL